MPARSVDNNISKINIFQNLKILSYNIHGLENKIANVGFFDYVRSFDIFSLLETHVVADKTSNFNKYFANYNIYWIPAIKLSKFGRAIGGSLFGIKKTLKNFGLKCSVLEQGSFNIYQISLGDISFSLIPLYIRGSNWREEFNLVYHVFAVKTIYNPIIIGDLNIRIGEMQQHVDEYIKNSFLSGFKVRKSKDSTANAYGKEFMKFCDDFGLLITNGITAGDELGDYTFINSIGQSVNDVCAVSYELLGRILSFSVENQIGSDHLPIVVTLEYSFTGQNVVEDKLLPKLRWIEERKTQYKTKLDTQIHELSDPVNVLSIRKLTDIIYSAADFDKVKPFTFVSKNKWFNIRCHNARKKSFRALERFRETGQLDDKLIYINHSTQYRKVLDESKSNYFTELDRKIQTVSNSKDWWKIATEIRNTQATPGTLLKSTIFRTYFMALLNPSIAGNDIFYVSNHTVVEELDAPIEISEIKCMLNKTKNNKAPGVDRIPYEFFKNASDNFLLELSKSFTYLYDTSLLDESFISSIIYPIFKKGDRSQPNNYRGISFMNCIAKILMGILNERLYSWVEKNNGLCEYQAGFRKNYSTVDNVYNLSALVALKFNENKKLYAFFIDFRAAFDKIPRKKLLIKLQDAGVSTKFVNFICSVYSKTESIVWTENGVSEPFETKSGVKQGCLLSPLLFALYINDLNDNIEGGIKIGTEKIKILLYADDIVLLSESPMELQKMITNLEEYCSLWNLDINLDKSEIMVFRKGGRLGQNETWKYGSTLIRVVSEYKYLGVIFTPRLSFSKHIDLRTISSKNSINIIWNSFMSKSTIPLNAKWKVFQAVCRAIQTYAAQVWGYGYYEEVDKLQRYFLKRILKLPSFTPNYILAIETNTIDGSLYTLDLHLRYIYKTLFIYQENRLPHKLTKLMLQNNIFWVKELNNICLKNNLDIEWMLDDLQSNQWYNKVNTFLENIYNIKIKEKREKISASNRIYKYLDTQLENSYITDQFTINEIMYIFKARSNLIELNGTRFDTSRSKMCSLCCMNVEEDLYHFMAVCPILRQYRFLNFSKPFLIYTEFLEVLNGKYGWHALSNFISKSLNYRSFLINEFNF